MDTATLTADHTAQQRRLELTDCINHTRRAGSAAQAAAVGEPDATRRSALIHAHRRLCEALRALQDLAQ